MAQSPNCLNPCSEVCPVRDMSEELRLIVGDVASEVEPGDSIEVVRQMTYDKMPAGRLPNPQQISRIALAARMHSVTDTCEN